MNLTTTSYNKVLHKISFEIYQLNAYRLVIGKQVEDLDVVIFMTRDHYDTPIHNPRAQRYRQRVSRRDSVSEPIIK